TLYDTANGYTTSEDRIGTALGAVREKIILCTKSSGNTPEKMTAHLENSLKMLRTDYLDVLQIHNPSFVPKPGGEDGLYDCLLKARAQGKIRFIGITAHSRERAREAAESGLYDVLQYPLSYLSSVEELDLITLCQEKNVGLLAMKGLCGGLLTNIKAAFAFLRQYENVFPIWGMQKISELDEFISYENHLPVMDEEMERAIETDRAELSGSFCRGCGYCLPCPANVPIPMAARITFLLNRSVRESFTTEDWRENMRRIDGCTGCGHCKAHCPYRLDTPELLKRQQKEYFSMLL
ncbi:MAG: aldo/keto reductase, partial [Clostridiales bacterium]|nr:aldo/keto reductase [Clostridiales bacterium]